MFLETDRAVDAKSEVSLTFWITPDDIIKVKGVVMYNFSNGLGIQFTGPKQALEKIKLMVATISRLNTMVSD